MIGVKDFMLRRPGHEALPLSGWAFLPLVPYSLMPQRLFFEYNIFVELFSQHNFPRVFSFSVFLLSSLSALPLFSSPSLLPFSLSLFFFPFIALLPPSVILFNSDILE